MPCRAIEYGLFAKVDCRTAIDCHRTRHCGSRGGNWGQASLARSPHPTSVRSLPSGLNCVCMAVSRRGGWPPTAVSGCRESGGMERSGTSSAEYCLALSTITAVKHDREIAVVSARHNCSREVEDEQQVKLDGAVAAGPDCKSSLPEAELRQRQGGGLQIQLAGGRAPPAAGWQFANPAQQQDGFRREQGRREREFCKCRNFGPSLHAQMELLLDL